MRAVPICVPLTLCDGSHWLASIGPDGGVVVGADGLIQSLLAELTAEAIEAGTTAVQEDTCVAVEWGVPLTHHIIVALATCPANGWDVFIIGVSTTGGSGKLCFWRSTLSYLLRGGNRLVGQCGGNDNWVTLRFCHPGSGGVLADGWLPNQEGHEEGEEEKKMAG